MRESDRILARDLTNAGLPDLAARAEKGEWNDFFGDHDFPAIHLVETLRAYAAVHAAESAIVTRKLIQNVTEGKYDGTEQESLEWSKTPEGVETYGKFGLGQE